MSLRTSSLLAALGKEGALDVALLLLARHEGLSVGDVVGEVNLSQPTVSRRLRDFESAGLVDHGGRLRPFCLREPVRVRALLRDASLLAEALLTLDEAAERDFRERLGGSKGV